MLRQGAEAIVAKDVVEELEAEEGAAFVLAQSDPAVLRAGAGIAALVVLDYNDGGVTAILVATND